MMLLFLIPAEYVAPGTVNMVGAVIRMLLMLAVMPMVRAENGLLRHRRHRYHHHQHSHQIAGTRAGLAVCHN